jgi:hypothetical protein
VCHTVSIKALNNQLLYLAAAILETIKGYSYSTAMPFSRFAK